MSVLAEERTAEEDRRDGGTSVEEKGKQRMNSAMQSSTEARP
jgi:hypothetical protein